LAGFVVNQADISFTARKLKEHKEKSLIGYK
jgi:hypothetical protein